MRKTPTPRGVPPSKCVAGVASCNGGVVPNGRDGVWWSSGTPDGLCCATLLCDDGTRLQ